MHKVSTSNDGNIATHAHTHTHTHCAGTHIAPRAPQIGHFRYPLPTGVWSVARFH
jgi:hypothetical protein